ncbi:MAG: putative Zn-dependent protease [Polaribacter sp.]
MVLSSCGRDDDRVIIEDKREFNAEELQVMSTFLEESISDNSTFVVINPQSTSEIAAFYEYLDRIYQSLVNTERVTNRNKFIWVIHVLQDEESKNTFITPGGAMYITTAMLKTIQTEHELISILAHEICYADNGLLLEKIKSEYDGTVLFQIINGQNPTELLEMAASLKNISFTEEEVIAADNYAVDIICDFLYDPHGMRDFTKRAISNELQLDWMDNRPGTVDRSKLIEQAASGCGPGGIFEDRYQGFLKKLQ